MNISRLVSERRFDEAAIIAGANIQRNPTDHKSWAILGLCFRELGDLNQAFSSLKTATQLQPAQLALHTSLAAVALELGKLEQAESASNRVLLEQPSSGSALLVRAGIAKARGNLQSYANNLVEALEKNPESSDVCREFVDHSLQSGRFEEAYEFCQVHKHVLLSSSKGSYLFGEAARHKGKLAEAKGYFQIALDLDPTNEKAAHNLGTLHFHLFDYPQAKKYFKKVVELSPKSYRSWHNLALIHQLNGRLSLAEECLRRAIDIEPTYEHAREQLINLLQQMHRWDESVLVEAIKTPHSGIPPFTYLPLVDDPMRQKKISIDYVVERLSNYSDLDTPESSIVDHPFKKKIRIGYFTADVRSHATVYLMSGVFRLHDREKFEIFLYSYGPPVNDAGWDMVTQHVDELLDCSKLSNREFIDLAKSHSLDIAIDLKGHTQDSRTEIFSSRLAPVQVSYLGYPGTSGLPEMDYIVADRIVIPSSHEKFYTEKVVRLPNCYQPNDNQRVIAKEYFGRESEGLPVDGFVYCCLNQNYKITAVEIAAWSLILNSVENSVLWLLESNKWAKDGIKKSFFTHGISPDRILFSKKIAHSRHLARLQLADLFLDTFNVNAHTTASDALWAGVPVLTKLGDQFAARVCGSLLLNVGLPDLITTDVNSYVEVAIECGKTPELISKYKKKLDKSEITECPLYNTEEYVLDFEALLEKLVQGSSLQEPS